ncbi:MAG: VanZ family protein [Sedimenticola sp.]
MKLPGNPKTYRLATVAWMAVITILSHQPGSTLGSFSWLSPELANLLHIPSYGLLALLAWLGFSVYFRNRASAMMGILLFTLLFATFDEWHQSFVPGRVPSLPDILNDLLGAGLALLFAVLFRLRTAEEGRQKVT